MTSNSIAIIENGGKIPVLSAYGFETEEHFSYQEKSEVNFPILTDKYPLFNYIYSIRDLIIFVSFGFLLIISGKVLYFNRKLGKIRKILKK